MQLVLKDRLLFTTLLIRHGGSRLSIPDVIVDTGSAHTLLSADALAPLGVAAATGEDIRAVEGVGGSEFVFSHRIDRVEIGEYGLDAFLVHVGEMEYGFDLSGILGLDFLMQTRAVLDLGTLSITFPGAPPIF